MGRIFKLMIIYALCAQYTSEIQAQFSIYDHMEALVSSNNEFNGSISGYVVESGTGEALIGANVVIKGTVKGNATNVDGYFTVIGIDEGDHILMVSYLGFKSKEVPISITSSENTEVTIELEWEGVTGDVIMITAQARGQVSAINQQLASNTIANVVARDRIQELPDVNAAESIGRLPGIAIERSGGEASKVSVRGLSPKFTTVTVNGVRVPTTGSDDRSVDLSLIASNMLDGIEVKKAITADMDADAVAGSVDLKLRDAPSGWNTNLLLQGGYGQLQEYYGNYKVSGTISNRFLAEKFGVIATFSADEFDRSADKLSAGYSERNNIVDDIQVVQLHINRVGLFEENVKRARLGGSLLLDYKIPNGKVTGNIFFNRQTGNALNRNNDYFNIDGRSGISINVNEFETNIMTNAVAYEQTFNRFKIDGGISYSFSNTDSPREYFFNFRKEAASVVGWVDEAGGQPLDVRDYIVADSSNTWLANTEILDSYRREDTFTAQLNLERSFTIGEQINGKIKVGFKYTRLTKENDENRIGKTNWQYENFSNSGNGTEFLECAAATSASGLFNGNNLYQSIVDGGYQYLPILLFMDDYDRQDFLSGDFPVGYSVNSDAMINFTNAVEPCSLGTNSAETAFRENVGESRGNDYNGFETYTAGYAMGTFNIGRYLTLIPGVRLTRDQSEFSAERFREVFVNNTPKPPSELTDLTAIRDFDFILPTIHVQIDPTDWLKFRYAYTETLSRPNFQQLIPRTNINFNLTFINANNTNLRPSQSVNQDFSISAYRNKLGLFTVSYFTKNISDLIRWHRYNAVIAENLTEDLNIPDGSEEGESDWLSQKPAINTYINIDEPTIYKGIEFDWQTSFWYLPSILKGLVLNINYTNITSKTTYLTQYSEQVCVSGCGTRRPRIETVFFDTTATGRAESQPAHIANLTVGYDFKGFSARVSYLFQTDRVAGFDAFRPIRSTFSGDYSRWDLTLNQDINENIQLFANFTNLTNTPDENFIAGDGFENVVGYNSPTYIEYYGFTADVGIRINR